jgi:hypothetical protein
MKTFLTLLLSAIWAASGYGQTIKTLGYNTTNGRVVYSGTNDLTFTNSVSFAEGDLEITAGGGIAWAGALRYEPETQTFFSALQFLGTNVVATTRTNIGLGATSLTNTNVTNFRAAIGLNNYPDEGGAAVQSAIALWDNVLQEVGLYIADGDPVFGPTAGAGPWRTNLGLGATNSVAFRNITSSGNIVISNQSTNNNGLLFIYRTNNEPFLGLANLIASNNTTISNETLFRVGVAEATNRSAQFGFRTVRTNNGGEGFATFSVFGYNALMMIGPSDRSRTNTATNAGIEADIWTMTPTNRVATLRDTNSGAFTLHQELGFSTNNITTNAPANATNVALWLRVWVGTNTYRLPLYQ